ncbi:pentapeptide repeat-containing protein [Gemmata sp. JC717]|uniref:pentapeptide repeat-containing protein n=1 Tax=Gemmata algarum TaxID=2975278 RepID=UPI0021BB5FC5|nr:pentapeptide repeat-containing protein [Gemmata algarum]MDY3555399.1 pentapeptide repeat-containing protein [Gemmata algarum]
MAKVAAKKTATKAAPKGKAAPKAKPTSAKAKPKAALPKPAPVDWPAALRSGEAGVKKWNNLTARERNRVDLSAADLSGADLTAAKLDGFDLRGVDLTGALLNNMSLTGAKFDEATKWPEGFVPGPALKWKGAGADPRTAAPPEEKALPAPADFGGFLARLKQVTDPAKLDKAAKMLQAERFRLYARVNADSLVGVVKSQTAADLVYSCRLGSDGKYACCTQNLNMCGGLRGSPCKHLLVLLVGLSRAGELDAATAHQWTQSARGQKPELDKDVMTATFLQYKGAEAGEVDWRPTETVPEDFYAM